MALAKEAPLLLEEADLDPALKVKIDVLKDRLAKETFFRDVAEIEQAATAVGSDLARPPPQIGQGLGMRQRKTLALVRLASLRLASLRLMLRKLCNSTPCSRTAS